MDEDSKSTGIITEAESVTVCIDSVLILYKHVWEFYGVFNRAIKEGTQAVNGLDSFELIS